MFEEYRRFTLGAGKDLAAYSQLKEERGLRWPVVDGRETRYRYAAGFDPYVEKREGVHFYKAKAFGEKAAFWLRPYQPPAESPDEEYPLWLTTGRILEHWHTGSMTRRVQELHRAAPEAYAELNVADAEELGVSDGDRVRLSSRRGDLELRASLAGRGQPPRGTVFVPFFDEGRLANLLTLDAMDNISKEPDFKKCAGAYRASLSFGALAALAVSIACATPPDTARDERRAYDGAPPTIPHEAFGASCIECHRPAGIEVAELGPRTGVSARHDLGHGARPMPPMSRISTNGGGLEV